MGYYSKTARMLFGGPAAKTVKLLIWINTIVYVLQLVGDLAGVQSLAAAFALIPWRVTHELALWQFVTYMFLHGGVFHILFNMITLYMFGNDLERYWGSTRFLRYYLITGAGAGFCSWLVGPDSPSAIVGASGAIYGILMAYGLLYPNRIIYLNFLLPIKVKWMVLIMGAVAFFSSLSGGHPGVAHVAHLGGMLVGYVMLRGQGWVQRLLQYRERQRREKLKRQFEVYYGDVRRKIDQDNKKGPTVH
jgi:membrane associated rhomboid family serine protease